MKFLISFFNPTFSPYNKKKLFLGKLDFISNFCASKKVKVFNFLQPDLFFKEKKSKFEKSYCEFQGEQREKFCLKKYIEFEEKFFDRKYDTSYLKNISLLRCFDKYEETIFFDRSHTADKGYEIIAKKISDVVAENIINTRI